MLHINKNIGTGAFVQNKLRNDSDVNTSQYASTMIDGNTAMQYWEKVPKDFDYYESDVQKVD